MRLFVVSGVAVLVWIGVGRFTQEGWAALVASIAAAITLAISGRPRWSALAPIPPTIFSLGVVVSYAAWPSPPDPYLSLLLLGASGTALHLAVGPLGRIRKPWQLLAGLGLSLGVLSFSLALAEWTLERGQPVDPYALRPTDGRAPRRHLVGDPELGMRLRPGFQGRFVHPEYGGEMVEINADGFRGGSWPSEPDPDSRRVLLLGDSSVFGMGAEERETISGQLERLLSEIHPHGALRVLNAGVPSYGPRHEHVLLKRLGPRLRPRLCLVMFHDNNDLDDCRRQFVESRNAGLHAARLRSEDLAEGRSFHPPDLFATPDALEIPPLWARTYWVRYTTLGRSLDREIARHLVRLGWVQMSFSYNHELLRAMRREPDLEIQEELRLATEAVRLIDEDCRREGIVFGLMRLPGLLQCEPQALRRLLEGIGQDPGDFDRRQPGATVLADAVGRGIPTLDLMPMLEVGERQQSPYYFREGHPNRAGNLRIAQAILEWIERDERLSAAIAGPSAPGDR